MTRLVCPADSQQLSLAHTPKCHHKYLDNIERTPVLTEILGQAYADVIRRNASIALANIGKRRAEALTARKRSLDSAKGNLKQYYLWAISTLEDTETTGINPSAC